MAEKIMERRVFLTRIEVEHSTLALDTLLRMKGIEPTRPYTRVDQPWMEGHLYIQRVCTDG